MAKIAALIGVLSLILVTVLFSLSFTMSNKASSKFDPQTSLAPTPTPMAFEEITIPSLKKRKYESSLGPLTIHSSNNNYISYSTYFISDGYKINGELTIPKGDMPLEGWKAIVFVHGYIPPSAYNTFSNYESYVDYLAKSGFVVFKIDLRGHADSEGEATGAYYASDYVVDTLNARKALQGSDFVDPEKIGLWGHSMAGNVVTRAWVSDPSINAVVVWAGAVYTYSDMQKYGISDNSYRPPSEQSKSRLRRNELFKLHGQFNSKSIFWSKVPITNYLSGIQGSIQIHHSIDDDVVNIGYSRDLAQILKANNIKYEFYEYPTGGHNIIGSSFDLAMKRTVLFFDQNL